MATVGGASCFTDTTTTWLRTSWLKESRATAWNDTVGAPTGTGTLNTYGGARRMSPWGTPLTSTPTLVTATSSSADTVTVTGVCSTTDVPSPGEMSDTAGG
ncbi:hypothetical protein COSO111634_23420 [Corallococcus soli]